jgi:hypothetical protein
MGEIRRGRALTHREVATLKTRSQQGTHLQPVEDFIGMIGNHAARVNPHDDGQVHIDDQRRHQGRQEDDHPPGRLPERIGR